MNNQEVVALLQECKQALNAPPPEPSEEEKTKYWQCEASLSADLRTLLKQAKEMKWPFVPERWQYKQEVCAEDKTNLKDIISEKLPDLLVFLKTALSVGDYASAAATVFVIDRFLYWVDASSKLLQVAKALHRRCMAIPIAPQVVIRQARVSANSGKLLKAEYILSSLINNCGGTGTWVYENKTDCTLVQAVSIQIRGQILQKLGLWYEAAELIWASIVGFYELPRPDKKGISTSLGILADLLVSMSDEEYKRFKKDPQMDLILVEECNDRLLAAAEASKLAAVLSQYNPLYVLTNLNIYGTCLLSYNFKGRGVKDESQLHLKQAKEAIEIGLLTKRDGDVITSKHELHGFVKAAFSLTTVLRWLTGNSEILTRMRRLCKEAMGKLFLYSTGNQESLAQEIMELICQVKVSLQITNLCNSDSKSYVPDHYKHYWDKPIVTGRMAFDKILERHEQYHKTICMVFESSCRRHQNSSRLPKYSCITAFKTETMELDTADAKASIPHLCDRDIPRHSLPKEAKATQSNEELQNRNPELTSSGKSENQYPGLWKDGKVPHASSENAQPHAVTGTDNKLGDVTSEGKDDSNNGCGDHLNDSHGSSSSFKSWLKTSGSRLSSSWEEVRACSGSGSPRSGGRHLLLSLDTECSTFLTDEVEENQQNDCSAKNEDCKLSNKTAQSERQISQTCRQFGDSNINCTSGNTEKKIPPFLSSGEHRPFEMAGSDRETVDDNAEDHKRDRLENDHDQTCRAPCKTSTHSDSANIESSSFEMIDSDAETADDIQDAANEFHLGTNKNSLAKYSSSQAHLNTAKTVVIDGENSGGFAKRSQPLSEQKKSMEMLSVDPAAETADETEENDYFPTPQGVSEILQADGSKKQETQETHGATQMQNSSVQSSLAINEPAKGCIRAAPTAGETTDGILSKQLLNSSLNSSSSFNSWCKSLYSGSGSNPNDISSSMSSSSSSFVFLSKQRQTFHRRVITDEDYKLLFAGVTHEWLTERIRDTGVFYPHRLKDIYSGLLFKYNKKTDTWTAQETLVYVGKPLVVDKPGAQRTALEIRFLHQEEILGRYVGKQYKNTKELSYHFHDVERQMTAQHYVTEFNKRLYEQQVPTQIYYIPSSVLLLLEDNQIVGCVSVEPYMLGKFIKLTNNKRDVRKEYEATIYGLAFGHFTYEFSNQEEIVVDLQGWITGDGKGLIYLTDPQIHSVKKHQWGLNFADKGIEYFLNCQHKECNEICHILNLKNPVRENVEETPSA
ncbi:alpha-protein kinase 1 isoform X1 [Amblyraja radiata]|uniref:alpha-protein kinase 1 isoform X1 n=1 Tax=Amblyraja radiata TaxID=386614 RepID=UPI001402C1B9|nr:alpha-protein kinase 1 isoform X1 [Amblyraja radiata]